MQHGTTIAAIMAQTGMSESAAINTYRARKVLADRQRRGKLFLSTNLTK